MEEAKKNMYAFSTTTYTGFQCTVSEETSEKFKGMLMLQYLPVVFNLQNAVTVFTDVIRVLISCLCVYFSLCRPTWCFVGLA